MNDTVKELVGVSLMILDKQVPEDFARDKIFSLARKIGINVTQAGAGGHALNLAESDQDGGGSMSEVENVAEETTETEQVEEVALAEGEQEPAGGGVELTESEVKEAVYATNLPTFVKRALEAIAYENAEALQAAIAEATEEVKKLTGSGKPFGQGSSSTPKPEPMSEADIQKGFDDIYRRHGLQVIGGE